MNYIERFEQIYHMEPEHTAFVPYRVCPLGAHVDHNLGKVTGFAIDKGIHIAFKPKHNGVVEMQSLQFEKRAQWHVMDVPEEKENDWADYLRGATKELANIWPLKVGISGVVEGDLPIGGLSSSAAVTLAFLVALCKVNDIELPSDELIEAALRAENDYVGVSCGRLDQSCEVYCEKNNLLYLDTLDGTFEQIPTSPKMKPYKIAVFFSGQERSLGGTAFNMRTDELKSAAYALKAFSGMEYGKFQATHMREVPYETYLQYGDRLPETWHKRAEHFYSEVHRVEQGVEAWRKGDIDTFGRLIFESGASSIHNWETGSEPLIKLYDILRTTDGIYGGRFSGAGFKGCCMALVDPAYGDSILRSVEERYLKELPEFKGKYVGCLCDSADGVSIKR